MKKTLVILAISISVLFGNVFAQGVDIPFKACTLNDIYGNVQRDINDVEYNGNMYVAVGADGLIMNSINLKDWVVIPKVAYSSIFAIEWTGQEFVAIGSNFVLKSKDGANWEAMYIQKNMMVRELFCGLERNSLFLLGRCIKQMILLIGKIAIFLTIMVTPLEIKIYI